VKALRTAVLAVAAVTDKMLLIQVQVQVVQADQELLLLNSKKRPA
jgi:hypothetical protein